ncbi:hypothetical protein [Streptomyces sp. NPDC091268]|uniref:hypothetical protein n=1 Tax=Streptomyces sp. NPDC091268 TaxID=3365979 RepID=UPI00382E9384
MLHARAARAHSTAGALDQTWRHIDAYFNADVPEGDLASMYWINRGELHQGTASPALSLGEPRRAPAGFTAALADEDPYDTNRETRGTGVYRVRPTEGYLAPPRPRRAHRGGR